MPYPITDEQRDRQIEHSLTRTPNRLVASLDVFRSPIALVGFGPSLISQVAEIGWFNFIMTCSGAHQYLLKHEIIPSHHIEADPRKHKAELIGLPCPATDYLIASTCHKDVWDLVEGYHTTLWHTSDFKGGSSVGTYMPLIAYALGFRDFHFFGIDGCFLKNMSHASNHPSTDPTDEFTFQGTTYQTTGNLLKSAFEFRTILKQLPDCTAKFYGEGIVGKMWEATKKEGGN